MKQNSKIPTKTAKSADTTKTRVAATNGAKTWCKHIKYYTEYTKTADSILLISSQKEALKWGLKLLCEKLSPFK